MYVYISYICEMKNDYTNTKSYNKTIWSFWNASWKSKTNPFKVVVITLKNVLFSENQIPEF